MSIQLPTLIITINSWTLRNQTNPDGSPWSLDQQLGAVKEAGFEAYSCLAETPDLKASLERHGLRFGAAFDAANAKQAETRIQKGLSIDNGPMNCQLMDHDTPLEAAAEQTIALMEASQRLGGAVHLEMHRDTCTETPEKTYAIAEAVKKATGQYPKINFDFSHPAIIKHLDSSNYNERLFVNVPLFQQSTLWHMRPFNGHHCQVPVTDGKGNFSPEYEEMRPFIRQAIDYWLDGPRPGNEFWIMPELGPKMGYGLSCFPDSWQDAIVLGNDIRKIWSEALKSLSPN